MKKVLAVSGGIDSMVMLHKFRNDDVLVAHFNHGIRKNSDQDEDFVQREAARYNLDFISHKAHLGADCSENDAREARYGFLHDVVSKNDGRLYVAHHQDDVIESVAINLLRGTGWRGLTPMYRHDVERPLLNMSKRDIFAYAVENNITYREDPTNNSEDYLRNRVRFALRTVKNSDPELFRKKTGQLIALYNQQLQNRQEIEQLGDDIVGNSRGQYLKAIFNTDAVVAMELLRASLEKCNISLTRPQLERALWAIRNFTNGKKFSLNKEYVLEIGKYYILVKPTNLATKA